MQIVSFSYSLDNLLLKDIIIFTFGKYILKWRLVLKNVLFLTSFLHVFGHKEKDTDIFSAHRLLT